jgi:hypothetical protein
MRWRSRQFEFEDLTVGPSIGRVFSAECLAGNAPVGKWSQGWQLRSDPLKPVEPSDD